MKVPEGQNEPAYSVVCMHEHPKIVDAKPGRSFGQINHVLYEAWTKLSDAENAKYILAPVPSGSSIPL